MQGLLSYTLFISIDRRYIIHFTQWDNHRSILYDNEQDSNEQIAYLSRLSIQRFTEKAYLPYKTFEGNNHIENANIIVFVKQYFDKPNQCEEWVELILAALDAESPVAGLIVNTYYIRDDGKELLNYALWESEEQYNNFLKHSYPKTARQWAEIESFAGWIKEKGRDIQVPRILHRILMPYT